jgi:DNA-binding MarR family transcriptional regulator
VREPASQPLPLPAQAATALLQIVPYVQRVAEQAVKEAGALSAARVRMLLVLTEGSRRGSEIAERWGITRAAVAESAAALERDGYLRRAPDRDDGRAVRFALTPKGRRAMEKFGLATATAVGRQVARLSPAGQRALLGAARELLRVLTDADAVEKASPS